MVFLREGQLDLLLELLVHRLVGLHRLADEFAHERHVLFLDAPRQHALERLEVPVVQAPAVEVDRHGNFLPWKILIVFH